MALSNGKADFVPYSDPVFLLALIFSFTGKTQSLLSIFSATTAQKQNPSSFSSFLSDTQVLPSNNVLF